MTESNLTIPYKNASFDDFHDIVILSKKLNLNYAGNASEKRIELNKNFENRLEKLVYMAALSHELNKTSLGRRYYLDYIQKDIPTLKLRKGFLRVNYLGADIDSLVSLNDNFNKNGLFVYNNSKFVEVYGFEEFMNVNEISSNIKLLENNFLEYITIEK